jgi:putative flippase GtrA
MKISVNPSLVKYIVVGLSAVVVDYGTFYLFYSSATVPLFIANSSGFLLGLATSFALNRAWTFKTDTYSKKATHQLASYVTLAFVNLILTNLIVEVLTKLSINPLLSKLLAIIVTTSWNYLIFNLIIFKRIAKSE